MAGVPNNRGSLAIPAWPGVWGIACLVVGISVVWAAEHLPIPSLLGVAGLSRVVLEAMGIFLRDLGAALVIAYVIGMAIDSVAKKQFSKDITKGLLAFIYGVDLDSKFFRFTEAYIIKQPFYRFGTRVSYSFLERSEDRFLVEYVLSYTIKNISEADAPLAPHGWFSPCSSERPVAAWAERLGPKYLSVNGSRIPADCLMCFSDEDIASRQIFQGITSAKLKPRETAEVEVSHLIEVEARDAEVWQCLVPSDGIEVSIIWPKEFRLRISAAVIHPQHSFCQLDAKDGALTARLTKPLLVSHGFHFWWAPLAGS